MEPNTNASPAGGSASDFLSEDAAASIMEGLLGPEDDEQDPGTAAPEHQAEQGADEPPVEAQADDESAQPVEDTESEETADDSRTAKGSEWTTLRDGERIRIADLKKSHGELQEFKAQQAQWNAHQQQFAQHAQRVAQQAQFFDQAIQNAIAIQQAHMPPAPDASLRETDPIEYFMQKDRYETEKTKLNNLVGQQQAARAEAQRNMQFEAQKIQQAKETQTKEYITQQQKMLLEKMPELRTPEKARAFYETFKSGAREYGFDDSEAESVFDHRLLMLAKDAFAYRALQKAKPSVQAKAKDAAPVQQPGRRVTPNEVSARDTASKMDRLRKSGSQDDAAAILMDFL